MVRRERQSKEAPLKERGASLFNPLRKKPRRLVVVLTAVITLSSAVFLATIIIKIRNPGGRNTLSAPPGVDFSSLAFSPAHSGKYKGIDCYLGMRKDYLKRGGGEPAKALILCLDAFLTGLQTPQDKFWVNLNYLEPRRVVDPAIAGTLTGRILLYGDLLLKQDVSRMLNPAVSPEGRAFWKSIKEKAGELGVPDNIVVLKRVWIEPDDSCIYLRKGYPCILRCSLRVSLESPGRGRFYSTGKMPGELDVFANRLFAGMILPQLNKRINKAEEYSSLRCVYKGLILAKAYKDNMQQKGGKEDFTGINYRTDEKYLKDSYLEYSSVGIYRRYLDETRKMRCPGIQYGDSDQGMVFSSFFIGGIDLSGINPSIKKASKITPSSGTFELSVQLSSSDLNAADNLMRALTERFNMSVRLETLLAGDSLPGIRSLGIEKFLGRWLRSRASSKSL